MQTPAEKELVRTVKEFIFDNNGSRCCNLLNIGGGKSIAIEQQLSALGCKFTCDRLDVEDCVVSHPNIAKSWQCSVEDMSPLSACQYSAAFSNYVLEHVPNVVKASREIARILESGGIFVATVPNPTAPEFLISKYTPLWLHGAIRRGRAWKTYYSYRDIPGLVRIFEDAGFVCRMVKQRSFVEGYLWKYPVLGSLARSYDRIVTESSQDWIKGDVCLVFEKPR